MIKKPFRMSKHDLKARPLPRYLTPRARML